MNCYKCNVVLDANNRSDEHIINNCIGGKLRSPNLLCNKCNSAFGDTIDASLEQQLAVYGVLLNIKLDRGVHKRKVEMVTKSGRKKYVGPGMVPLDVIKISLPGIEEATFPVSPNNIENVVSKKLEEMERKYNNIKRTQFTEEPTDEKYFLVLKNMNELGEAVFGGSDYYRSVAKICLNYYLYKGYPENYCSEVKSFVNGDSKNLRMYYYCPTNEIIHELGTEEVSHIIHLRGNKETGTLYAYIELFNMQNFIVVFDMDYAGEDISATYCHDILESCDLLKNISLRLLRHHLEALPYLSKDMAKRLEVRFNRLFRIIERRQITYQ